MIMERVNVLFVVLLVSAIMLTLSYSAPANSSNRQAHAQEKNGSVLEVRNSTFLGPREDARAMCSVRTLEGNATANVTISRRLHGLVTPRELHSSMHRLEVIIHGQMQLLWQSLEALRTQLGAGSPAHAKYQDKNKFVYKYYVPNAG